MIKVLFNGESEMREVSFSREGEHLVTLIGALPETIDGFRTYRMNGQPLGDFTEYKTIYRWINGGVQLSNDGSTWSEPEKIDEPEQTKPTTEERIQQLEAQNETLLECLLEMSEIVYA